MKSIQTRNKSEKGRLGDVEKRRRARTCDLNALALIYKVITATRTIRGVSRNLLTRFVLTQTSHSYLVYP